MDMMVSVATRSFSKATTALPLHISHRIQQSIALTSFQRTMSSSSSSLATADLCDKYVQSPTRLTVAEPGIFHDYGGITSFSGTIETIKCFESNPLVRKTLNEAGNRRVLVVDGGASRRCAILGDDLAKLAHNNDWAGLIMNGCIRDSAVIKTIPIGVKALATHPLKSIKTHEGERACVVAFAGVEFVPGHWVYADEDGIVISETALTLDS